MSISSLPTRALLSCAALMALSSAVVPGLMPQRARVGAARLNNGVVHRLLASRWGGTPPPEIIVPVERSGSADVATETTGGPVACLPLLALHRPEYRSECLTLASLVATPWQNLSPFSSRPPPQA
ncbi:MAG: hypothetical protein ABR587_05060 [Candidatus Binatia bacterium]